MRRDVRILLVGDGVSFLILVRVIKAHNDAPYFPEGVGKSTIVTSLIKEAFVPHVSPRLIHRIHPLFSDSRTLLDSHRCSMSCPK
jgi:hypothetical protein